MDGLTLRIHTFQGHAPIVRRFEAPPVRIGRHRRNDLVMGHAGVSRWHGVFWFDEASIQYVDLGSTNGTRMDGERLDRNRPVRLATETSLRFGDLEMEVSGAPVRSVPAPLANLADNARSALEAAARIAVERTGPPDERLVQDLVSYWLSQPDQAAVLAAVQRSLGHAPPSLVLRTGGALAV